MSKTLHTNENNYIGQVTPQHTPTPTCLCAMCGAAAQQYVLMCKDEVCGAAAQQYMLMCNGDVCGVIAQQYVRMCKCEVCGAAAQQYVLIVCNGEVRGDAAQQYVLMCKCAVCGVATQQYVTMCKGEVCITYWVTYHWRDVSSGRITCEHPFDLGTNPFKTKGECKKNRASHPLNPQFFFIYYRHKNGWVYVGGNKPRPPKHLPTQQNPPNATEIV